MIAPPAAGSPIGREISISRVNESSRETSRETSLADTASHSAPVSPCTRTARSRSPAFVETSNREVSFELDLGRTTPSDFTRIGASSLTFRPSLKKPMLTPINNAAKHARKATKKMAIQSTRLRVSMHIHPLGTENPCRSALSRKLAGSPIGGFGILEEKKRAAFTTTDPNSLPQASLVR